MKQRGRPVRGAIAGFLFGLFVSADLVIFGVFALDADVLALFPVLGLIAGIALGVTAPLPRRSAADGHPEPAPVVGAEEPEPATAAAADEPDAPVVAAPVGHPSRDAL